MWLLTVKSLHCTRNFLNQTEQALMSYWKENDKMITLKDRPRRTREHIAKNFMLSGFLKKCDSYNYKGWRSCCKSQFKFGRFCNKERTKVRTIQLHRNTCLDHLCLDYESASKTGLLFISGGFCNLHWATVGPKRWLRCGFEVQRWVNTRLNPLRKPKQ